MRSFRSSLTNVSFHRLKSLQVVQNRKSQLGIREPKDLNQSALHNDPVFCLRLNCPSISVCDAVEFCDVHNCMMHRFGMSESLTN